MKNTNGSVFLRKQHAKLFNKIRTKDPQLAAKLSALDLGWYRIKNSADGEVSDIYIYDEIMPNWMVEWWGSGVSAEGLIAALNEITASNINVRINSPGGDVFEAIAIYNTLVSHQATINVYVDALAASAASIIAMAGDKITMMVGSQMMIHDAMGVEMGNAADMRAMADFLDQQSDNIASIYANKAGGEIADWRALMLAETWAFAEEAVEMGLADSIYSADQPSEEDQPEEDNPEEEPSEETPDEENPEEPDQEQESDEEEELNNLMNRRHSLVNRGFKHAGRRKAPQPANSISNREIDNLVAAWANFGRK